MKITGGKVYTEKHIFKECDVCTRDGRISENSSDNVIIDATGLYVIPGLIDIHLHGALGRDFCECDEEELRQIAEYEASQGILALCPATMTYDEKKLTGIVNKLSCYVKKQNKFEKAAEIVGINMEGPFISPERAGAQNPEYICDPDVSMFERLQSSSGYLIKMIDIAPERPGGMEYIRKLSDKVNISLAHTNADYDIANKAFKNGARHMTHLFNAMPGIGHRAPGPVIAARENGAEVEVIADGIHLHPAIVRFIFDVFGEDKVCLISDSMEATGLADGEYHLGGREVIVNGKKAVLKEDSDTVAGSVTNLFECLKTTVSKMGVPLERAIRSVSENPAKAVGLSNDYGNLDIGKIANIVIVDSDLEIRYIINRGNIIFKL